MTQAKDRPPSFQFYPRDYLSSRAVSAMHPTARGGYVHLLCHAWLGDRPGWLPADDVILAALSGLGERWAEHRDSIARAWRVRKGWWVQPNMVATRRAQKRRRNRAVSGANTTNAGRWGTQNSVAQRPDSESLSVAPAFAFASSVRTESTPLAPRSAKKPADSSPVAFEIEATDGTVSITEKQVFSWQGAYPGVEILQELRKAAAWQDANPSSRKTSRGISRFLNSWLNRAQNSQPRTHHDHQARRSGIWDGVDA